MPGKVPGPLSCSEKAAQESGRSQRVDAGAGVPGKLMWTQEAEEEGIIDGSCGHFSDVSWP